ncbi:MAG TPA: dienelactone hydrolase family protein [Patescibacteria group bacterium]|nr:dienelactone hydrolase family protein [Patescibacteria group bacterium]
MNKNITIAGAQAYHTYPDDGQKHPGLVLIEEVWGVNEHIRSVADRFANVGFSVVAPELLPPGLLEMATPQIQKDLFDPVKRDEIQPKLREAMEPIRQPKFASGAIVILKACVDYLMADEHVNGRIAVLGFCFGGTYAYHLAAQDSRIKATIPFYGQPPKDDEIPKIICPVLAFYGDQDAHLMETLPKLKETMQSQHKNFEAVVYPNIGHAFFNDTNTRMYNKQAADDAWQKAVTFLENNLK